MQNLNMITEYKYEIKQEKSFKKDLRNIYEYISDDLKERNIANKLLKAIDNKIKILETFPFAYELYKKEENFEY